MPDSLEFEAPSECSIISNNHTSFFICGRKGSIAYIGLDNDWVVVHAVGGHGKEKIRRARLNPPCECKFGVFSADDESLLLLIDKYDTMRVFDLGTGKMDTVEPPKGTADDQTNADGQQHFVSEFDTVTSAAAISDKSHSRFLISTYNSLIDLYVSSSEKYKTHKTGGFGFDIIRLLLPCLGENAHWLVLASYDNCYVGLGEIDGTFYPLIESSDGEVLDAQMSWNGKCLALSFSTSKYEVICWDVETVLKEKNTNMGEQSCAVSGLRLRGFNGPSRVCWCSSEKYLMTSDGDECALWDVSDCSEVSSHIKDKSEAMILSGLDGQILGVCSHPCLNIAGVLGTTSLCLFKTDSFRKGGVQAPFASISVPLKVGNTRNIDIFWGLDDKIIIRTDQHILSVDVRAKMDAPVSTHAISQLAMHLIPIKKDQDAIATPSKKTESVHQDSTMERDDEPSSLQLSPLHGLKSKLGKIRTRPKSPKNQEQSHRYSSSVRTPNKPAFQPPPYNYYSSPTYVAIDSARMVPGPCSPPMGYFPMSPEGHYSWARYPGSQVYYAHPNTFPVWYNDGRGGATAMKGQCTPRIMQHEGMCGTPHHPAVHGYSMMPSGEAYGPFIGSSSTSSGGTYSSLSGEYEIFRMSLDQPSGSATQVGLSLLDSDPLYKRRASFEKERQRLQSAAAGSHHPSEATIYIGNLPNGFQEDSIAYMCSPWGSIFDIQIIRDKVTKISRGYAFVTFMHPEEAQLAIQNLNGQALQGPYGHTHLLRVGPSNRKFTCQAMRDVVSEETNHMSKSR